MIYDIAIIGAGPAGATLARLLAGRYSVVILDKRDVAGPAGSAGHAKCCGGLLAPDAQQALGRLRLGLPQSVLTGPQLFVVRAIDLSNRIERSYQRHYINMDRDAFDRWLVSLVPPAVEMRVNCLFKGFDRQGEIVKVSFSDAGKPHQTVAARVLVGADGAHSAVRRAAFPRRPRPRTYVAIQETYRANGASPCFSAVFDPEITDFYAWVIPKGDGLILGAALPPGAGARGKFELLKARLQQYGFAFGEPTDRRGALLLRPGSARHVCVGEGNIALVGEAAGWISPSSGEGLSYAMDSAAILAEALHDSLNGFVKRYTKRTKHLKRSITLKNLKSRVIYNPILRNLVMRSGLKALDISSP